MAIDKMLERLDFKYIDLLYVHQPMGNWRGAWQDMEKAVPSALQDFFFSVRPMYRKVKRWSPWVYAKKSGLRIGNPIL